MISRKYEIYVRKKMNLPAKLSNRNDKSLCVPFGSLYIFKHSLLIGLPCSPKICKWKSLPISYGNERIRLWHNNNSLQQ